MSNPQTRQELYDRIKSSSKQEVILSEMKRLGFWHGEGAQALPDELLQEKGKLQTELRQIISKGRLYSSREEALKEIHKRRMETARKNREEKKKLRAEEKEQRRLAWEQKKAREVFYLGEGVSSELGKLQSNTAELEKLGLPDFATHQEMAQKMGVSLGELKFLSYARGVSKKGHYKRFLVPKKSGGERLISAPMPRLKALQHWILENVLNKLTIHESSHGFVRERSIVSNAAPHVGADVVVNLDLRDFFPTVSYKRVLGMFKGMGYSPGVSTVLSLLCTEPAIEEVEMDGQTWQVAVSERHLPQGAPTSPAITNWLCRGLDARLNGIAKKHGFIFTRYADDLTFSAKGVAVSELTKLLWHVKKVIHEEGFHIHPDKLRIMRPGQRFEVTGLVVNDKVSVCRKELRAYRAVIHRLKTKGVNGATFQGRSDRLLARVLGYARFLNMVDQERFSPLLKEVEALTNALGYKQEIRHPKAPSKSEATSQSSTQTPSSVMGEKKGLLSKILGIFGRK